MIRYLSMLNINPAMAVECDKSSSERDVCAKTRGCSGEKSIRVSSFVRTEPRILKFSSALGAKQGAKKSKDFHTFSTSLYTSTPSSQNFVLVEHLYHTLTALCVHRVDRVSRL